MNQRPFGRLTETIGEVGFGAWAIGGSSYGKVSREDAFAALEAFVDGGGNLIDTARVYADSEAIIGEFLKAHGLRDRIFLATKVWPNDAEGMRKDLSVSLAALKVGRVDLLYLHCPPDDPGEMERALDAHEDLKREGLIRATGASVKLGNVTQATVDLARQYIRSGRVDALQLIFSVLRQKNREVFQEAAEAGVAIVARTIMESGFLTGKYHPGQAFPEGDHRERWVKSGQFEKVLEEVAAFREAACVGAWVDPAQAALRFALDEPGITAIIPGARNGMQCRANLAASKLPPFPAELRQALITRHGGREAMVNPG